MVITMALSINSPVTGSSQTGLTSPTYTVSTDTAPDHNGKQFAVTGLGGTQVGVDSHSIAKPFTLTWIKPRVMKMLGMPDAGGTIRNVGKNVWKLITRKGVIPAANQPSSILLIETTINVPAGAETYDAASVRAAISAHIGALQQQSAGLGDSVVTGLF